MRFEHDVPADSVFLVEQVRLPGLRNALRVFGALLLSLVAMGDIGASPSSHKFQVRLIQSGDVLGEFSWSEGEALLKGLGSLTAGEFADMWLPELESAASQV